MDNTTSQVPESSGNPIQRVKNWLVSDPKNLMLGLVFAASIAQPRQGGRNAFQTLLQRGAGAALLGGEMNRNEIAIRNAERERQLKEQEAANAQSNARVLQELERDRLRQQGELGRGQQELTGRIATMEADSAAARRDLDWRIAQLDANTQRSINAMRQSAQESPLGGIMETMLKAEAERAALTGEQFDIGKVMSSMQQLINGNAQGTGPAELPPIGTGTPVVEPTVPIGAAAALSELPPEKPIRSRSSADEHTRAVRKEIEAVAGETDPAKLTKMLREKGHRLTPAAREAIQLRIRALRGLPAPGSWAEVEAMGPRGAF